LQYRVGSVCNSSTDQHSKFDRRVNKRRDLQHQAYQAPQEI
jgi:hypothetical protein